MTTYKLKTRNTLTEKGKLSSNVRASIASFLKAKANPETLGYEESTAKNNVWYQEFVDEDGVTIYATLTLSVSLNDPEEVRNTKRKPTESIDIE